MKETLYTFDPSLVGGYADLLFARGWVLTRGSTYYSPDHWSKKELFGFNFRHDPKVPVNSGSNITIIGEIFYLRSPKASNVDILSLCEERLYVSFEALIAFLEECNGNYVIFCKAGQSGLLALNDATGMSSIFYDVDMGVLASHSLLAAVNADESFSIEKYQIYHRCGFPGRFTPYSRVFHLNPNLCIDLSSRTLIRYNLIQSFPRYLLYDVIERFSDLMKRSVQAFSLRKSIIMSLTAGLDSRTTLSACKGVDNMELFTYYRADDMDNDDTDRAVAVELASRNGLKHRVLSLRENRADSQFLKLCTMNSHYSHMPPAAYNYHHVYGERDVYHLRSNQSEIGRAFYAARFPERPESINVNAMLKCYTTREMRGKYDYKSEVLPVYKEIFRDYMISSEFESINRSYDFRDIFYWEHRMGSWYSQIVSESASAFTTLSAFNCNAVLKLMLSLDFELRRSGSLMKEMIRTNWPELLELPINPATADEVKALKYTQTGSELYREAEIAELKKNIDDLAQYSLTLEKRYQGLLRSRTWRVLGPVRALSAFLRGLAGRRARPKRELTRPGVLAIYERWRAPYRYK